MAAREPGAARAMSQAWNKIGAVAEVSLAFAAMHVAFRAFKRYTEWGHAENESGLNFSPGVAMIVVTLVMLAVRRREPGEYGLSPRPFFAGVNAALVCLL